MTQSVDYDLVAPVYAERYERYRFDGVEAVLRRFVGESQSIAIAEVGCGTGHWLDQFRHRVRTVAGLDFSHRMLQCAQETAPCALLVRGRAERLPLRTGAFDRLFCINSLQHFYDVWAFMLEARRVLRPGGGLLTIGLDPHTRLDSWWLYDYFPAAFIADRARYLPTTMIRERLEAAGFTEAVTEVAQHIRAEMTFAAATESGRIDRRSTSQLMVISDVEYEAGLQRLRTEQPTVKVDLRLYATVGWVDHSERSATVGSM